MFITILPAAKELCAQTYFPPPDSIGGWRAINDPATVRGRTGIDLALMDEALEFAAKTSKHGGLLVARHGWLVYERYFGKAHREATPNHASIGKAFTSVAAGILLRERPDLFPHGLDQKVFGKSYFPAHVFPLSDPRKADIKLGHLLAMTAGIRGNNPGMIRGLEVRLDPAGPDGWPACADDMAAGRTGGPMNTTTLWCAPGEGYSYATSSPHLVSMMIRHITGKELEEYVREKLAAPMGWERWGWGYKNSPLRHTCGGGGIAVRPTDMLRFGYLLLREGRWGNSRLVPAGYVHMCRRPSPYNPHFDYSLQFDVNGNGRWRGLPRDAFWKTGSGGHILYVIPSLDLVIYRMGGRDDQYDQANTGVAPLAGSTFRYDGSREGWRAGTPLSGEPLTAGHDRGGPQKKPGAVVSREGGTQISQEEIAAETLRLVLAALSTRTRATDR